jgi:hypothetical protein
LIVWGFNFRGIKGNWVEEAKNQRDNKQGQQGEVLGERRKMTQDSRSV